MSIARLMLLVALAAWVSGCDAGSEEPDSRQPSNRARPTEVATAAPLDIPVPAGSSGSLVAALDGELVACAGWGHRTARAARPPAATLSTTSCR